MMAQIGSVRELEAYKMAFEAAMRIFLLTRTFPAEERFSLTDQIRRASRSVCTNLSEGWRKRRYKAVFGNKLSDAMQEASETQTWLEFSLACGYVDQPIFDELFQAYENILGKFNNMERKADTFCF